MKSRLFGVLLSIACVSIAQAASISQFEPQGSVADLRDVRVSFDQAVVAWGDAHLPAPVLIQCNDSTVYGQGRWLDARRWIYEFSQPPGPGLQCVAQIAPDFRDLQQQALQGKQEFSFHSDGPSLERYVPSYGDIHEDQAFLLKFNAVVSAESVQQHSFCIIEGVGEKVPTQMLDASLLQQVTQANYLAEDERTLWQGLQCQRSLPPGAKVTLVLEPGIYSEQQSRQGIRSQQLERLDFTVREPFSAQLSCTRDNAQAPCTPMADIRLQFSAPVPPDLLQQVRLQRESTELSPADPGDSDNAVVFAGPFAENTQWVWRIPADFQDDMGRPLANLAALQEQGVQIGAYPPLIKFAAAPFAIVERFAHADAYASEQKAPPALALSVRRIEPDLVTRELSVSLGQVHNLHSQDDLQVLQWYSRLLRANQTSVQASQLHELQAVQELSYGKDEPYLDLRSVSLLAPYYEQTTQLRLPGLNAESAQQFELLGIPLNKPGFHVLEIASERLGAALLGKAEPMYVRSSALVTNLGVHIKQGQDDVLVWVTTLDDAQPVAQAQVSIMQCDGTVLAQGLSNEQGIVHRFISTETDSYCPDTGLSGLYVTARLDAEHKQARGQADFSFAFSSWNRGIEPWRFQVPYRWADQAGELAHTIFDRSLFLAGETVHMKHYYSVQHRDGLRAPQSRPDQLELRHQGSDRVYTLPLLWQDQQQGSVFALNEFTLPKEAPLGLYQLMGLGSDLYVPMGEFRVEEFKLPWLKGSISLSDAQHKNVLIAPDTVQADIQLEYVAGGAAGHLPATLSAVQQSYAPGFSAYPEYSFSAPSQSTEAALEHDKLFLNKRALVLDEQGGARVQLDAAPAVLGPAQYLFELSFADPNGQIQTLTQTVPVWPAAVQPGLQTENWLSLGQTTTLKTIALDPDGQAVANAAIRIEASRREFNSTRKRLVGGFYSYDNIELVEPLGVLCEGRSDKQGLFSCDYTFKQGGDLELIVIAQDQQGRESTAATQIWVSTGEQSWFAGGNDDRIDLLAEKPVYAPGERARFQVRMPFREASALISVEREGVLHTQIAHLKGDKPTVELLVQENWGPNVYVSALVLRGRVYDVPWQSFFSWGWKRPAAWYEAYQGASEYRPPSQLVDLSKPAYRFGLASIQVNAQQDALQVQLSTDSTQYKVREQAQVQIQVKDAHGQPAAHANIAFAAVDAALLELSPNTSWDLLTAMRALRPYGVLTATAQSEIVGRRHYGRKALPAGGGGGKSPTRELLDTLLLWEGNVQTNEQGRATVQVPLNDVLSRFVLVAVAEQNGQRFGTGKTEIISTQDVQLISGLPTVVRDQDQYQAQLTVRNSSERAMNIQITAQYGEKDAQSHTLKPQQLRLEAGAAGTLSWWVQAPVLQGQHDSLEVQWRWQAQELDVENPAQDSLLQVQKVLATTPVTVQQAALAQVRAEQSFDYTVQAPKQALRSAQGRVRGGIEVNLLSSLAGMQPGVQQWFERYPYTCFEQQASRFMGMQDAAQWDALMLRLPAYLSETGLLRYFPSASLSGSVPLTAYVLDISHEAQRLGMAFTLPDAQQSAMLRALQAYAQGRLADPAWLTSAQQQQLRLVAIETLSRYGQAHAGMLDSVRFNLAQWPSSSLLDFLAIYQRLPGLAHLAAEQSQAESLLRTRLRSRATTLYFDDSPLNQDALFMVSPVSNQARLLLLKAQDPEWVEDIPRLFKGLLAEQRQGAWRMTTENLLGSLAVMKFAQLYENEPEGQTQISVAKQVVQQFDWNTLPSQEGLRQTQLMLDWPGQTELVQVSLQGQGSAWVQARSWAAIPETEARMAGIAIERRLSVVHQAQKGRWSVGDSYLVQLRIRAQGRVHWAVLTDPIPAGASILGSGLGRDSALTATAAQAGVGAWPSYIERKADVYRAYFDLLPDGQTQLEYVVRLNTVGDFSLPPTRIEALYNPDIYGLWPNPEHWKVHDASLP